MVKIAAVIRPDKLEDVKNALDDIGVGGVTVMEVRGVGRQGGYVHRYRGAEYVLHLPEKIRLETVVPDALVEQTVSVIVETGRTGEVGDGKIFLIPLLDAVRVRTGERGDAAIQ